MTKLIYLTGLALAFAPMWSFADECGEDLVFLPTRANFEYASGFGIPTAEELPALQRSVNLFGRSQQIVTLKDLVRYLHEFSYVEHGMNNQLESEDRKERRTARKLSSRMSYLVFDKGIERLSHFSSGELAPYFAELCVIVGNLLSSTTPDESLIRLLVKLTGITRQVSDLQDYRLLTVALLSERLAGTPMTPGRFDEFRYWTNDWIHDISEPEQLIYSLSLLMSIQILHSDEHEFNPEFFKFLASDLPRQFARKKKPLGAELRRQTAESLERIITTFEARPGVLETRDLERIRFLRREVFGEK